MAEARTGSPETAANEQEKSTVPPQSQYPAKQRNTQFSIISQYVYIYVCNFEAFRC